MVMPVVGLTLWLHDRRSTAAVPGVFTRDAREVIERTRQYQDVSVREGEGGG